MRLRILQRYYRPWEPKRPSSLHAWQITGAAHAIPSSRVWPSNSGTRVWSPYMVKDGRTCLGLEYFVTEGDGLWQMDDRCLVELGPAGARADELSERAAARPAGAGLRAYRRADTPAAAVLFQRGVSLYPCLL